MKKIVFLFLCSGLLGGAWCTCRAADEDLAGSRDAASLLDLLNSMTDEQVMDRSSDRGVSASAAEAEKSVAEEEKEEAEIPLVEPKAVSAATPREEQRPTKITSQSAVYNRKEGFASFSGRVHLDDAQYQMHADRVYVFTSESNEVKRVVAMGHVALTNDLRCAYGAKATYSRANGLVVLYSGDGIPAEVVDHSKEKPQVVKGEKIRFWIDSEQVEVLKADISGPAPTGSMKNGMMKDIRGK